MKAGIALVSTAILFANSAFSEECPTSVSYGENASAGRSISVNGIGLYYETYGSGAPLLIIHGNGGSIRSMRCQIVHFSRTHRVIVADSRSHGKSNDGSASLTYQLMADDLTGLLNEEKLSSVDVIGHSDGGIIGLLLAIKHPEKVKRLVVSGPNLRPDDSALYSWNFELYRKALKNADEMLASGDTTKNWRRIKIWNELMLREPNIDVRELGKNSSPTLVMGSDDDAIRAEHLLEIYRALPHSQLAIIPGATHLIHREQYELYNQLSERFLSRPFSRPTSKEVMEKL